MSGNSESHFMSDEQLVKDCIQQKPSAQKSLFDKFSRKMMGLCMRYASDTQEAQDIVQDGFIKVFNSIEGFNHNGSLEGWVKRIMINTALDAYRKNKKRQNDVELDKEHTMEISDDDGIVEEMSANYLMGVVQTLPEGYKIVFNMFAVEGYSHKEIAEKLGISVNTSKSQYSRARVYLQKILSKKEVDWTND
jgi:RNA polymerase sigma factor (sigma-70 family)